MKPLTELYRPPPSRPSPVDIDDASQVYSDPIDGGLDCEFEEEAHNNFHCETHAHFFDGVGETRQCRLCGVWR